MCVGVRARVCVHGRACSHTTVARDLAVCLCFQPHHRIKQCGNRLTLRAFAVCTATRHMKILRRVWLWIVFLAPDGIVCVCTDETAQHLCIWLLIVNGTATGVSYGVVCTVVIKVIGKARKGVTEKQARERNKLPSLSGLEAWLNPVVHAEVALIWCIVNDADVVRRLQRFWLRAKPSSSSNKKLEHHVMRQREKREGCEEESSGREPSCSCLLAWIARSAWQRLQVG